MYWQYEIYATNLIIGITGLAITFILTYKLSKSAYFQNTNKQDKYFKKLRKKK